MTSTWLSIRVDLVEGGGQDLWPRPGRIFAAARTHTFGQLSVVIDDGFARWDRAHLYQYYLAGGRQVSDPRWRDGDDDDGQAPTPPDPGRADLPRIGPWERLR